MDAQEDQAIQSRGQPTNEQVQGQPEQAPMSISQHGAVPQQVYIQASGHPAQGGQLTAGHSANYVTGVTTQSSGAVTTNYTHQVEQPISTTGHYYIPHASNSQVTHHTSQHQVLPGQSISGAQRVSHSMSGPQHITGSSLGGGQYSTRQGASYVTGENTTASYVSGSRIVTGEERVIGVNTIQQEERVISERIVEHEVKVPKRIVREEVIERVIVVPETIVREEVIEETQKITETIIEVAKPQTIITTIEVPEIVYVDKIVESVEKIIQEKIVEVPKIQYEERLVEVPRIVYQDKIVEVPEIEYREVIVEKVIEVPEVREHVVVKEVPVPQYIEKPVQEIRDVPQPVNIERNIPVPVEAITTFEYQLAQFRPRVNKVQYPLYVPRFVEVPVSAELFDEQVVQMLESQANRLQVLSSSHAIGLCEVENLATEVRRTDTVASQTSTTDLQAALTTAWKSGRIAFAGAPAIGGSLSTAGRVPMTQTTQSAGHYTGQVAAY